MDLGPEKEDVRSLRAVVAKFELRQKKEPCIDQVYFFGGHARVPQLAPPPLQSRMSLWGLLGREREEP